jgi:O-antigen/teichoic acid export membrane protein
VAVAAGAGVTGGIAVLMISGYLSLAVAVVGGRMPLRLARSRRLVREIGWAALPFAAVGAIGGLDVVLARHYLPARAAGYYVAAAVAGKIVLWAPAAVGLVAFPEFASEPHSALATLRRALLLVSAICVAALVVTLVFQRQVIGLLFGDRFLPAADVIVVMASAMTLLALVQVVAMWAIARSDRSVGMLAAFGVPTLIVLVAVFHGSTRVVAFDVFGAVTLTAVAVGIGAQRLAARTRA